MIAEKEILEIADNNWIVELKCAFQVSRTSPSSYFKGPEIPLFGHGVFARWGFDDPTHAKGHS